MHSVLTLEPRVGFLDVYGSDAIVANGDICPLARLWDPHDSQVCGMNLALVVYKDKVKTMAQTMHVPQWSFHYLPRLISIVPFGVLNRIHRFDDVLTGSAFELPDRDVKSDLTILYMPHGWQGKRYDFRIMQVNGSSSQMQRSCFSITNLPSVIRLPCIRPPTE